MKPPERIAFLIQHARTGIGGAFRWWLSELWALVPPVVKSRLSGPQETLMISIARGEAVLRRIYRGGVAEIHRAPLAQLETRGPAPPAAAGPAALVALSPEAIFIDRFKLPAAAHAKLRQILSFEMERRSPFQRNDALFDFSVIGRDATDGTLTVEWAVVPIELVQRAQATAQNLGLHPAKVGLEGETPGTLRYVFARQATPQPALRRPAKTALLSAAVVFICSLTYAAVSHGGEAAVLAHSLNDIKADAIKAEDAKIKAERMAAALAFIAARAKQPQVSEILAEVTKALPDDSWVYSAELSGNELTLIGYSGSASSLIEKLVAIPLFDHPHFRTAITPEAGAGGQKGMERFDIALKVNGRYRLEAKQ